MKTLFTVFIISLTPSILFCNENHCAINGKNSKRIAVVVNNYLSNEITESLNTYFKDLMNEGYDPILKEWSLEENPSPSELKEYLKGLYNNGGLQGAVLVGDLPVALFEDKTYRNGILGSFYIYTAPYPTDHYYMDLESDEWKDTDGNGYLDKPITSLKLTKRAIWVSRLKASGIQSTWSEYIESYICGNLDKEVKLIKSYFNKNHEFRTGKRLYEERSWSYVPSEWSVSSSDQYNEFASFNKATDFFLGDMSKENLLKLLAESSEMGMWIMHAKMNRMLVNKDPYEIISNSELHSAQIETAFLLPLSCWIGDYTTSNYFAGSLLFSETSGVQALTASTIPALIGYRDAFVYPFQEGYNFGESYLNYFSSKRRYNGFEYAFEDERATVILGDGTLKRQRYLIGSETVEARGHTLRSAEVRKEITPSFIIPIGNTLRFCFSEKRIFWDKYYNQDGIIYRLEKQGMMGNKILVYEGEANEVVDENIISGNYYLTYVWNDTESKPCAKWAVDDLSMKYGRKTLLSSPLTEYLFESKDGREKEILDKITMVRRQKELMSAMFHRSTDLIYDLLNAGVDPNTNDPVGWTPLDLAINYEEPEIVALLILHRADLNKRGLFQRLPLDYALEKGNTKIIELLIEAGGKSDEELEVKEKLNS